MCCFFLVLFTCVALASIDCILCGFYDSIYRRLIRRSILVFLFSFLPYKPDEPFACFCLLPLAFVLFFFPGDFRFVKVLRSQVFSQVFSLHGMDAKYPGIWYSPRVGWVVQEYRAGVSLLHW